MAETKIVQQSVIEILCEQGSDRHIAEEISFGIEEQGVNPRIRSFSKEKEYFVQAFESAQRGYGVSICIIENEIMIFAEETGNERPLFRYCKALDENAAMLRGIGKNAVHIVTRQPFELYLADKEEK